MKRKLASLLAIAMMLTLALPQAALAASSSSGTYNLTVTISDSNGTKVSKQSGYVLGTEPLVRVIAQKIVEIAQTDLKKFDSPAMNKLMQKGLSAYTDQTKWTEFITTDMQGATGELLGDDNNPYIKSIDTTVSALDVGHTYTLTYKNAKAGDAKEGVTYTIEVVMENKTSGGGGGGGGGSTTTTTTTKNPDGSTTTTTTNTATGVVSKTTKDTNGVTGTTVTDKDGKTTEVSATIPASAVSDAAKDGEVISLPVEVPTVSESKDAPVVKVTLPSGGTSAKVEIPAEKASSGLVAVIVDKDGKETIVPKSVVTEDGVVLELTESANVKIIDNSKDFTDVPNTHWADSAVDFVSSRELFQGVSATTFAPEQAMTRGMLATVLYRLESTPGVKVDSAFSDVKDDAYYADGVHWAAENGVVSGYGDGTYQPNKNISRQELVTMLYRYAGQPAVADNSLNYSDAQNVSDYAKNAMRWAVDTGIIKGMSDNTLNPQGLATRAQVATMLMRYCENAMKA